MASCNLLGFIFISRINKSLTTNSSRTKNSPDSSRANNYNDALTSINQAQRKLQLQSPSILQRTQQQLVQQQQHNNGRPGVG